MICKLVSAHEFGHLLGVGDLSGVNAQKFYGPSIYDSKTNYVTSQDIEMVLEAFCNCYFVTWGGGNY